MSDDDKKAGGELPLTLIEFEHLARLRAELALAESRVELARERFERAAADVSRSHGHTGSFTIDFDRKLLVKNPLKE